VLTGADLRRAWFGRVKLTSSGLYKAFHSDYRHKRSQKTAANLQRLRGPFTLPKHIEAKLRKAGFKMKRYG